MAITRAQQAKQMLQDGGMLVKPSTDGKRPGYRSARAQEVQGRTGGSSARERGAERSRSSNRTVSGDDRREQVSVARTQGKDAPTTAQISRNIGRGPTEIIGGQEFPVTPRNEREREQKNFARSLENDRKRRERIKRSIERQKLFKNIPIRNKLMLDSVLRRLDDNLVDVDAIDDQFTTIGGVPIGIAGALGKTFKVDPSSKFFDEDSIREIGSVLSKSKTGITKSQADTLKDIREDINMRDRILDPDDNVTQSEFEEYINRNKVDIPDDRDGSESLDPCLGPNPPAYCATRNTDPATPKQVLSPRILGSFFDPTFFAADGGRAPAMDGGIMNIDNLNREAFLLGGIAKGIKKAVRGVKKLAKSPIGKLALTAAAIKFGGGFGKGLGGLRGTLFGQAGSRVGEAFIPYKEGLFTKLGLTKGGGSLIPTIKGGITLASILPLLAGKQDDEFDIDAYYASQKLTPATTARQAGSEFDFYNYNLAEGGTPRKEPVAKKVMPLLDMDGMEKDYRAEGGFVPIGRMEKADDVPARLSKNEFVFTADAVRNAGDGDVDKVAEVMYNMMKNLEAGGEVSEESQGLDGAREMFQTSQRLGEVI